MGHYEPLADILIVEDSSIQAEMLRRLLADAGYRVQVAADGAEGLQLARAEPPDLVISDITMPLMDGFELCREIRTDPALRTLPVILLTAMSDVQDVVRGLNAGADNYVTKPYDPELLLGRVRDSVHRPSQVAAERKQPLHAELGGEVFEVHTGSQQMLNLLLSIYRNALDQNKLLQSTQEQLTDLNEQVTQEAERKSAALIAQERRLCAEREACLRQEVQHWRGLHAAMLESVAALAATVELRAPHTAGHQRRVAELAVLIGSELGWSGPDLEGLRLAGVLHDIGMARVPAEILTKPGALDPLEFSLVKVHAQAGYEILRDIRFPWPIADMVVQHHERLDGSGYPRGLRGGEILPAARILALADVVEAMSRPRPHRPALDAAAAIEEARQGRGSRFDPAVVDAFLAVHGRGLWCADPA